MRYIVWVPGKADPKVVYADRMKIVGSGGGKRYVEFREGIRTVGVVLDGAVFEAQEARV